jgi:hypothetical protein
MKQNISCCLIQDLLPNYIEHLTSKETNEIVSKHLEECDTCRHEYDLMNSEEKQQEQEVEIDILKNALVKTKRMYLLEGIIIATAVISVLVTAITNLAVEHTFSWFYLVLSSMLLVTVESIILVFKQNGKIKGALLGLTVMILPYLYSMEKIINYYYLEDDINWFMHIALPIACLWIGLLWLFVWGFKKMRIKVAFRISICSFICMFGAIVTNYIVLDSTMDQILSSNWINILCFSIVGIGSLGISCIYGKKK